MLSKTSIFTTLTTKQRFLMQNVVNVVIFKQNVVKIDNIKKSMKSSAYTQK